MARLTSTAWFGPKRRVGWGWTPTSWQGWVFTLVWVVVMLCGLALLAGHLVALVVFLALATVVMAAVAWLTGGPPGGPGSSRS